MNLRRTAPMDVDRDDDDLPARPRRPWALIGAALLLAVLVVVLWFRWTETRAETLRLRAELKDVYVETEKYRLEATQAHQKLALLEPQLASMRAERDEALAKLVAAKPKPAATRPRR